MHAATVAQPSCGDRRDGDCKNTSQTVEISRDTSTGRTAENQKGDQKADQKEEEIMTQEMVELPDGLTVYYGKARFKGKAPKRIMDRIAEEEKLATKRQEKKKSAKAPVKAKKK
jgi:hypothetical protein